MAYTLDEFSADCHRILKADPGAAGREQVRQKLEKLLFEDDFIDATCGPDARGGANVLYEDTELGFQILAHIMEKGHAGGVHDHGASWAIYGQAVGYTDMTEWKRTDNGTEKGKATVAIDRTYRLERGQAGIFQDHAIHSIAYPDGARFIRVTGVDLQTIERGRYDVEAGTMVVEKRPNFKGAA
jgi:predicted metal-dependent enzyme (double-stranded beta helix superfamily)